MNCAQEFQPRELGLNGVQFPEWREGQYEILMNAIESEAPVSGHCAGCGFGKTLIMIAYALATGHRTLILTPFKGLQDQLLADFPFVADLRGKSSYPCEEYGDCDTGALACQDRNTSNAIGPCYCPHKNAMDKAANAQIVVTNYACWINLSMSKGIGKFHTIICDEADQAEGALGDFLSFTFNHEDVAEFRGAPKWDACIEAWIYWANSVKKEAKEMLEAAELRARLGRTKKELDRFIKVRNLEGKVQRLAGAGGYSWVCERFSGAYTDGAKFDAVWPGRAAGVYLFRDADKVILLSGTLNRKHLDVLGARDYDFFDYPSPFHVSRNPLILLPIGKYNYPVGEELMDKTVQLFDKLVDQRMDRKGICQSISFKHAEQILGRSRHRRHLLSNNLSNKTVDVVDRFRKARPPTVMVSPSLTSGYSFEDDACRWQFILKVPFPDTQSLVAKARKKQDPEYYDHQAMTTLVQMCSRPCRSVEDYNENITGDTRIGWFLAAKKHLAPRWFVGSNGLWRYRRFAEGIIPAPIIG